MSCLYCPYCGKLSEFAHVDECFQDVAPLREEWESGLKVCFSCGRGGANEFTPSQARKEELARCKRCVEKGSSRRRFSYPPPNPENDPQFRLIEALQTWDVVFARQLLQSGVASASKPPQRRIGHSLRLGKGFPAFEPDGSPSYRDSLDPTSSLVFRLSDCTIDDRARRNLCEYATMLRLEFGADPGPARRLFVERYGSLDHYLIELEDEADGYASAFKTMARILQPTDDNRASGFK